MELWARRSEVEQGDLKTGRSGPYSSLAVKVHLDHQRQWRIGAVRNYVYITFYNSDQVLLKTRHFGFFLMLQKLYENV